MFYFNRCKNSGVMDCSISGNDAATLLSTTTCRDIWFLSNTVTENHFGFAYFDINGASPVVGGCFFPDVDDSLQMIARVPLTNGNDNLREEGTVLSMDGQEPGGCPAEGHDLRQHRLHPAGASGARPHGVRPGTCGDLRRRHRCGQRLHRRRACWPPSPPTPPWSWPRAPTI